MGIRLAKIQISYLYLKRIRILYIFISKAAFNYMGIIFNYPSTNFYDKCMKFKLLLEDFYFTVIFKSMYRTDLIQ